MDDAVAFVPENFKITLKAHFEAAGYRPPHIVWIKKGRSANWHQDEDTLIVGDLAIGYLN